MKALSTLTPQIYESPQSVGRARASIICQEASQDVPERENPEAQVSILFRGASAIFLIQNDAGKPTQTRVQPGDVAYLAAGQRHFIRWIGYAEFLNLYLSETLLHELNEDRCWQVPSLDRLFRFDPIIYEIARLLMDEFVSSGKLPVPMIDHAAFLIGRRLFRIAEQSTRRETSGLLSLNRLQPAIDFLRANPEGHFTLSHLAKLCNSSTFPFARSFSARIGSAPFQFQRKLRVHKARELLRNTDLSIENVGCEVGIENPTHFARLFRRDTGVAPSEFRRLTKKQNFQSLQPQGPASITQTEKRLVAPVPHPTLRDHAA